MMWILSDIVSLTQYITTFNAKDYSKKETCPCCGKYGLWRYGYYHRKADRSANANESLNPVYIQRYYCQSCHKTSSALPECLPPHRWYLWEIQQTALALILAGKSILAVADAILPSRRTIGRWMNRFKALYRLHKDVLCNALADLGRYSGFEPFWQACLSHFSLAKSMRLCHVAGVSVS